MSEINTNNSSSNVSVASESVSCTSPTNSASPKITSTTNPDDSTSSSSSPSNNGNSLNNHNDNSNNLQTDTRTTSTTTSSTSTTPSTISNSSPPPVCRNGQQNDFSGIAELGLHNAFELLDIDSEPWKKEDEKIVECVKSPVTGHFESGVCGTLPITPPTSPPLTGVGVAAATGMMPVSGEEPLTGCISSLQKLKLLCQECRKTDTGCKCSKIYLKKKVSSSMLDKFNLARSSSSPRGVIKEARFRPHPSDNTEKSVLRASRLKFLSQLNAAKRAKYTATKSNPVKFDETNIFGQYSECSTNFASLAQKASDNYQKMPTAISNNPNAPQFIVYQNSAAASSSSSSSYNVLTSSVGSNVESDLDLRLSMSVNGSNSNAAVPFSIDQTCSLQARLDDMSVNELACYFEEYVHIPKKMSEMAEMMYR